MIAVNNWKKQSVVSLFFVSLSFSTQGAELKAPTVPTVAGAVSDSEAILVELPKSSPTQILQGPRNELYASVTDWNRRSYFYVPTIESRRDSKGPYARLTKVKRAVPTFSIPSLKVLVI